MNSHLDHRRCIHRDHYICKREPRHRRVPEASRPSKRQLPVCQWRCRPRQGVLGQMEPWVLQEHNFWEPMRNWLASHIVGGMLLQVPLRDWLLHDKPVGRGRLDAHTPVVLVDGNMRSGDEFPVRNLLELCPRPLGPLLLQIQQNAPPLPGPLPVYQWHFRHGLLEPVAQIVAERDPDFHSQDIPPDWPRLSRRIISVIMGNYSVSDLEIIIFKNWVINIFLRFFLLQKNSYLSMKNYFPWRKIF